MARAKKEKEPAPEPQALGPRVRLDVIDRGGRNDQIIKEKTKELAADRKLLVADFLATGTKEVIGADFDIQCSSAPVYSPFDPLAVWEILSKKGVTVEEFMKMCTITSGPLENHLSKNEIAALRTEVDKTYTIKFVPHPVGVE